MVKNRYVTKVWTVSHISFIVNRACVKTNVDDIPMSCVTEIADADLLNGHRVKWFGYSTSSSVLSTGGTLLN